MLHYFILSSVIYSTNNSMVKISNSFFENINTGVTEGIFVSIYSKYNIFNSLSKINSFPIYYIALIYNNIN